MFVRIVFSPESHVIGKSLNHYRIVSELGKGGMGVVYLAEDTRLKRRVALKILPSETSDPELIQRFRREAETVAALSHPNIVTLHSVEEDDGVHFLTMELVEGDTLDTLIGHDRLPLSRVFEIAVPLAGALSSAHRKGITHRDLKPGNVMMTKDGHVKVLDFGLAKYVETNPEVLENIELSTQPQLSSDGLVMGTVPYMSPEQAQGSPVDTRSDIFSFGVLLYEMTTGRRPFSGKTAAAVISSILKDTPPPAVEVNAEVPNHLGRIIRRCLEKDPARRYQTAQDLQNDLRDLQREVEADQTASSISVARAPEKSSSAKGPWIAIGILIGLATVVLGGWWLVGSGGGDPMNSIAVLPFENTSGDPETEYLGDGVTESLISQLSQLPDLKIMARNTVFRYKDSGKDPQEVGRELGVSAVLAGRVDIRGDDLIIGTELIAVSDGTQMWGERFSRPMNDLMAVEREISQTIADKLELELTGEEEAVLARTREVDSEAYRLFLKGAFHWNRRTAEDMKKAEDYFKAAIDVDPTFALAHAGLSNTYLVAASWGWIPADEARAKGKRAALKALELDPNTAEAHAALAGLYSEHDWDWEKSEAAFRRAIELKPGWATAHQWYGEFLLGMLRFDEAEAEIMKAIELDPLSLIAQVSYAWVVMIEDPGAGVEVLDKVLEMDPEFYPAHNVRVVGMMSGNLLDGFPEAVRSTARLEGVPEDTIDTWLVAYESRGMEGLWEARLEYMEAHPPWSYYDLAIAASLAGKDDLAYEYLEKSYELREPDIMYIRGRRYYTRHGMNDPRWEEMEQRLKFPPVPATAGS